MMADRSLDLSKWKFFATDTVETQGFLHYRIKVYIDRADSSFELVGYLELRIEEWQKLYAVVRAAGGNEHGPTPTPRT
jgi:hypothetical protein